MVASGRNGGRLKHNILRQRKHTEAEAVKEGVNGVGGKRQLGSSFSCPTNEI